MFLACLYKILATKCNNRNWFNYLIDHENFFGLGNNIS